MARLSVDLFDQTGSLHGLDGGDRELLEFGALLHDIGEHVSVDAHHKHTAYLVQHGRLRGFAPEEVNMLASLGRFHRRGEPKLSFEPYAALDPIDRERVTKLTALLRLADGLDRSHNGNVVDVDAVVADGAVRLSVTASKDAELELWGLRRKRDLFEKVFECRLEASAVEPSAEARMS